VHVEPQDDVHENPFFCTDVYLSFGMDATAVTGIGSSPSGAVIASPCRSLQGIGCDCPVMGPLLGTVNPLLVRAAMLNYTSSRLAP
jgi:hypothetical protein